MTAANQPRPLAVPSRRLSRCLSRWVKHAAGQRWQEVAAALLLLLMLARLLGAATQLSATIDEAFHITSGYEYLRTGRLQLLDEHTPLAKALFAWPLFFVPDLVPPEQAAGYAEGDLIGVAQATLLAYRPLDRVVVACRIPVALLALLLAATVYRWASAAFGPTAGVAALALFASDPNLLAHGSLATTDLGATAFIFWAVLAFAGYLRRPTPGRWWIAAVCLGLAQGAKLTALLLLPVLGLLALVDAWNRQRHAPWRPLLRRALSYANMVGIAALLLWGLYLFEVRALPLAEHLLPVPAAGHVERWLRLQENLAYGREAFLLGQNRMHGWWQYFPLAFGVKTPLPVLLLTGLAAVALLLGRRGPLRVELALALFPGLYGALSLTSPIDIGYRHLLPVLPFLYVSVGRLQVASCRLQVVRIGRRGLQLVIAVCLVWMNINSACIAPHYLAFFNAVAGGPDGGWRFLADSNTDWGQGFKALAAYQREHDLGPLRLSAFTFLDPAAYGVAYTPVAPMTGAAPVLPRRFNPEPGLYAISATTLDGVPLPLPSTYDWFRHREPAAKVAHALFVYDVQETAGAWVAQCSVPASPLPAEAVAEGFGSPALRRVYFDCEQSWVFPGGGASAGWYARATSAADRLRWPSGGERLEWWPAWSAGVPLDGLHLSYVQATAGELPAFAIWEWGGTSRSLPEGVETVTLGETLAFAGYRAPDTTRAGSSVDVLTYWHVIAPPARPLSLMLHLVGNDGTAAAVGDGLGLPVEQWQAGDLIVQRHVLAIPPASPPGTYSLHAGAYWLDDLTRLVTDGLADHVALATVVIEP